ncbi:CDP-glycerol glycerophosphotransferase family protein [Microbacterium amylolyticum]|uniref:CDP-glycerol glycerophosphotransferase n=1 Tax=Microbacterium amylolyticum TaxID=936337 RepID=A0ABS4ZL95_9MICO|nr:CDP-glycerol glycerophosphotransferase family protein [Microbacterium amylolyticum]MBP2437793.1 CDP-glycerol glycerophosphotransferase [Microbacterium amylolyticum]
MASFSFGAGNAAKLARIPLYGAGRLVTLLLPRGERWVFGCGAGIADGALEIWRLAREQGVDAVWLTSSDEEAREAEERGMPHTRKMSWRGFWATARARVAVVTHGFGDVNPYGVTGAFVAQLWHGIPLKRIGLDAPEMVRSAFLPGSAVVRRVIAWMYRRAAQRIGAIPVASHFVRGRFESAFGIADSAIVVTGEPRVDALSRGSDRERETRAREILLRHLPHVGDRRLVLYAPTWRDGDPDPGVPTPSEWREISELAEQHDVTFVIRSHRLGEGNYRPGIDTDRVALLGADVLADITPALPAFHALITDYSSLVYDATLVPLPALFLAPDLEQYAIRRGFYGRYEDVAADAATTWHELIPRIDTLLGQDGERDRLVVRARELSESVHAFRDGQNGRRMLAAIFARVGKA